MEGDHLWSTAGFCFGSHFVKQMCDMFLFLHEAHFTGYTDDNTSFVVGDNIPDVTSALEEIGDKLLIWFSDNQIKSNTDKCHLLTNMQDQNFPKIGKFNTRNSFSEKLLLLIAIKTQQPHRRYLKKSNKKVECPL